VAARFLPARHRTHLLALYAFARHVDDIGDEAAGDRLAQLDAISADLDRLFAGTPPVDPVLRRLSATITACGLPREPFDGLVAANRQDQLVNRYDTYEQLLGYCELSANPVGRMVLGVFGADRPELTARSDAVCTALQLLEHCQDLGEDARADRIYFPREDLDAFGVGIDDLLAPAASRPVRALIGFQVQRATRLLDQGQSLVGKLEGFARAAIAGYIAGGRATAAAMVDAGFDVLSSTLRPTKSRTAAEWISLLLRAAR
jgi:squalene synthase HpnC